MAVKRVSIILTGDDLQIQRAMDELKRKKEDLAGVIRFRGDTGAADRSLDRLGMKLDRMSRSSLAINVKDETAKRELENLRVKLAYLSRNDWSAKVTVRDYERTKAELDSIERKLREIKRQELSMKLLGIGGALGGATSGAPGGVGGVTSAGSGLSGVAGPVAAGIVADIAALVASLTPAIAGMLTGGGVAGGGILAGLLLNKKDMAGFKNNLAGMLKPLAAATRPLISGLFNVMGPMTQSFQRMGPQLKTMFSAAIPFVREFATLMERSGKVLIPAFTQTMKSMAPALPTMTQGLVQIVKALGYFLKDLGPGMQDSATIFKAMATTIKVIAIGLAAIVNFLAHRFVDFGHMVNDGVRLGKDAWHLFQNATNAAYNFVGSTLHKMSGVIGTIFTNIKNTVTHIWDSLWSGLKGIVSGFVGWVEAALSPLFSLISGIRNFLGGGSSSGTVQAPGLPGGRARGGWIDAAGSHHVDRFPVMLAAGERVLSTNEISRFGGPMAVDSAFGAPRETGGLGFARGGYKVRAPHDIERQSMRIRVPMASIDAAGPANWHYERVPSGSSKPTVININVSGALDPNAVAKQIRALLLAHKRQLGGNRSLGFGAGEN